MKNKKDMTKQERQRQIDRICENAYLPIEKTEEIKKYIDENFDFSTLHSEVNGEFLGVDVAYEEEFEEKLAELFDN